MHNPVRFQLPALAGAALLAWSGVALAAPPVPRAPGPAYPQFASADAVKMACDRGLTEAAAGLKVLERHPANGRWLAAQDAYTARTEDSANALLFLSAVHPDKALRDAAEAVGFYRGERAERVQSGDCTSEVLAQVCQDPYHEACIIASCSPSVHVVLVGVPAACAVSCPTALFVFAVAAPAAVAVPTLLGGPNNRDLTFGFRALALPGAISSF
jgi:hypothetical protein